MSKVKNQTKATELTASDYEQLVSLTGCNEKDIKGLFDMYKADNSNWVVDKKKFIKLFYSSHVLYSNNIELQNPSNE